MVDLGNISPDKNERKTPIAAFYEFPGAIQDLLTSIIGDKFIITSVAWKTMGYLIFLVLVYYFREPIFSDSFFWIIGIIAVALLLEIFIQNWPKINKSFRGYKTLDDIKKIGFDEENIAVFLEDYNFTNSEIEKIIKEAEEKKLFTQKIKEILAKQSYGFSKNIIDRLINSNISTSSLLEIIQKNPNSFDKKQLKKILNKYKKDRKIISACLCNQSLAIDISCELGLIEKQERILELRDMLSKGYNKWIVTNISKAVLGILVILWYASITLNFNRTTDVNYIFLSIITFFVFVLPIALLGKIIIDVACERIYNWMKEREVIKCLKN
ncbi:MAG: hypothetical protein WC501_03810 [Candidatus Micrarchaeia archaeon]